MATAAIIHRSVYRAARALLSARRTAAARVGATRALATNGDQSRSKHKAAADAATKPADGLFDEENTVELSPLEVARMRVAYGLVKEHVDAAEKGLAGIDADDNPLIDPRSFQTRALPEIGGAVLREFRKQVPAEAAAERRSVSTYNLWEAIQGGETHELLEEQRQAGDGDWAAVDERTMGREQYARLGRQSVTGGKRGGGAQTAPAVAAHAAHAAHAGAARAGAPKRAKGQCALKDERGRATVDFRAVATLRAFLSDNLKVLPRRKSGLCAKSQRKVAKAVKTARTMALLHPEPMGRLTVEEMMEMEKHVG